MGIQKVATPQEIREAYKKLVLLYHPDKGGDPEKIKELQNAYEIMNDPKKRQLYDKYGKDYLNTEPFEPDFELFSFFFQKKNVRQNWLN